MKILIIDDDSLDLFINKKILGAEFEVEGFTSYEDGSSWIESNTFDVALIDYYLGHGIHAHDVLKKIVDRKGTDFKALVLSNYVDDKQTNELKVAGFADVILKPITIESFKNKIKSLS